MIGCWDIISSLGLSEGWNQFGGLAWENALEVAIWAMYAEIQLSLISGPMAPFQPIVPFKEAAGSSSEISGLQCQPMAILLCCYLWLDSGQSWLNTTPNTQNV